MTEQEKAMLAKITELLPKLNEQEKDRTLAFIEGMAFKADLQAVAGQQSSA